MEEQKYDLRVPANAEMNPKNQKDAL